MVGENTKTEPEIISFASREEWSHWLEQNYNQSDGIWLRFFKKGSGVITVFYPEALDEALCYGWIDGQLQKYDEKSFLRKFTPRRARSPWSKINLNHIARLEKEGKMKPPGLKEVEAAKADGRWDRAYDPASEMTLPEDFLKELTKNKTAFAFFEGLNKSNKYAIAWRLQTAKRPETREKRMKQLLEMLVRGEKLH